MLGKPSLAETCAMLVSKLMIQRQACLLICWTSWQGVAYQEQTIVITDH